jgi:hypothetical protein
MQPEKQKQQPGITGNRWLILLCAAVIAAPAVRAQDTIVQKSGDEIHAKGVEITAEYVRYKKITNPSGPFYVLLRSGVFMVKYESGRKDIIRKDTIIIRWPVQPKIIEITTVDALKAVRSTGHYKLMAHLEVDDWTPICDNQPPFSGTFDGNGHTVTIRRIGAVTPGSLGIHNVGLFGLVGKNGTIRNLRVSGVITYTNSTGVNHVGSIAGYNNGLIENCTSDADITADGNSESSYAGGITGVSYAGAIRNCYSTGAVTVSGDSNSNKSAGGITGLNAGCILQYCYATGIIKSAGANGLKIAGGIAGTDNRGWNGDSGIIRDCVALNPRVSADGSNLHNYANPLLGVLSGCMHTNNYGYNGMTVSSAGRSEATVTKVTLPATRQPQWWAARPQFPFGTDDANPWQWDARRQQPVLYWEAPAQSTNFNDTPKQ